MKEQIYTIDIREAFSQNAQCPVCRLAEKRERDLHGYILGAAMMEPDVRRETNRKGFCRRHLTSLLSQKNKLGLGLILESLFMEINKAPAKAMAMRADTCYLCDRAGAYLDAAFSNIAHMWKTEPAFSALFAQNETLCMPHANTLCAKAPKLLGKKAADDFTRAASRAAASQAAALQELLTTFCKSFDHRNTGLDLGEAKNAVEKSCDWLGGARL